MREKSQSNNNQEYIRYVMVWCGIYRVCGLGLWPINYKVGESLDNTPSEGTRSQGILPKAVK